MSKHRSDGVELKHISPVFRLIPNIMRERSDSQVFFKQDIPIKQVEEYISKKAAENIRFSIMEVLFAACVRTFSQRPHLNRFIMDGRIFARNKIYISLTIKKSMDDKGEESTIKIPFEGTETIFEISEKVHSYILKNKEIENENSTDKATKILAKTPTGILKFAINLFKFLDKHGKLPKSLIELSPFHTSAFITNVGSIGIDSIYHHLYNFGTTSTFFAMGKKKKTYVYSEDNIQEEKCISLAFVGDERICDGFYYASSFKYLSKLLAKPELLEKPCERILDDEI